MFRRAIALLVAVHKPVSEMLDDFFVWVASDSLYM